MNKKVNTFLQNFSYTLIANLISLITSILIILLIPKIIGVEGFGYWQLYLFYSLYIGFLHFGWSDGIYLRYGGKNYNELDKTLFFSQFYLLLLLQIIIGIIIFIISFVPQDINRLFIFQMLAINLIITNSKSMLLFILQGTNRLKEFARIIIIEKLLFSFIIFSMILFGKEFFELIIVSDLIAKVLAFSYSMYCCKDIVFKNFNLFYFSLNEILKNISAGIKLMIANIASMLIIGVIRFGIELFWNVIVFAKVSLVLSISNFVLIFLNTISIVIFPLLRRTNILNLSYIYINLRNCLMPILLGLLTIYFPLKEAFTVWLPQYSDSLIYLALLFPMVVFEGKTSLLINTFLKTLRLEKAMLNINLAILSISILATIITTSILLELNLAIASITILLAMRSIVGEYYLSKIIKVSFKFDTLIELLLIFSFILLAWYIDTWFTFIAYSILYVGYLFIKKNNIIISIQDLKSYQKDKNIDLIV